MTYVPRPVQVARKRVVTRAVYDGRRLGVSMSFVGASASARIKELGAFFFSPRRMWTFAADNDRSGQSTTRALQHLFAGRVELELDDLPRLIDTAVSHPDPRFFVEYIDAQVFPLEQGGFAVSGEYDPYLVMAMRSLRGRFQRHANAWSVTATPDQILEALERVAGIPNDFIYWHESPLRLEQLGSQQKSPLPISVPSAPPESRSSAPGAADDEQEGGFLSATISPLQRIPVDQVQLAQACEHANLYDYQAAGVEHLASRSSALLGDDMGLGKTRQAVVACKFAAGGKRILILCPASLRINWEREIHAVYPQALVGMLGEDRLSTLRACQWVIANYERLGSLTTEGDLAFEVMAVDEAHSLKESQAGRTLNAFIVAARTPRIFLLTGTPLLNRETEVHTLLRLSGHPLGNLEHAQFRRDYSGSPEARSRLAAALADWMLRRPKSVLKNLGAKTRQRRVIDIGCGIDRYKEIYNDPTLTVMPKIVRLRQFLEAEKVDFLIETVRGLAAGDKIIIFAEYMETVSALRAALADSRIGAVSLVGSDSPSKRQAAVDAFQQDPDITVFIGTTSAAGVGITLTAANYVAFASLPWTPGLMRQAEDRAYRNGQKRDVIVLIPQVPGTIDEQLFELIAAKEEIEDDVVGGAMLERKQLEEASRKIQRQLVTSMPR